MSAVPEAHYLTNKTKKLGKNIFIWIYWNYPFHQLKICFYAVIPFDKYNKNDYADIFPLFISLRHTDVGFKY